MLPKTKKFTVAVIVLVVLLGVALSVEFSQKNSTGSAYTKEGAFFDRQREFRVPLNEEDAPLHMPEYPIDVSDIASKRVIGGVVPHHLLASDFLAEFFQLTAAQSNSPKIILLLSPNHFESGAANIQTADLLWHTPYGSIQTDPDVLAQLLQVTNAEITPQSFEAEHGVYNILPYIAHFLPEAKVVPIILRYKTSSEEIAALVSFLKPLVEKGEVFVVGSVDFSHYLSKTESDRKDAETLQAMKSHDLSRIARFQSDHLDSPATILTLLQLANETGANDIRILRHDNSADGTRGSHDSTTGHFSFFLTGKNK